MPFTIPKQIEPGSYPALLERITEEPGGKFGIKRTWYWQVETPDGVRPHQEMTTANNGIGTKSGKRLAALLGRPLVAGETVDDPTGRRAVLVLVRNEKGFIDVSDVLPYVEPQQTLPGVPR